jgi:hypothetical protein
MALRGWSYLPKFIIAYISRDKVGLTCMPLDKGLTNYRLHVVQTTM